MTQPERSFIFKRIRAIMSAQKTVFCEPNPIRDTRLRKAKLVIFKACSRSQRHAKARMPADSKKQFFSVRILNNI